MGQLLSKKKKESTPPNLLHQTIALSKKDPCCGKMDLKKIKENTFKCQTCQIEIKSIES